MTKPTLTAQVGEWLETHSAEYVIGRLIGMIQIQETCMTNWIQTKDRLPTEAEADRDGEILVLDTSDDRWTFMELESFDADLYPVWIPLGRYQPPAPEFRPFAGKDEFRPHRDRWVINRDDNEYRTGEILTEGVGIGQRFENWQDLFDNYQFEDGTPCGVQI